MSISYSQVQHFLTTVRYMNMNKAAQELYISQPGLSLSIARLESELEVPLFRRNNNKLTLTEAGSALLSHFEKLQADTDALLRAANEQAHPKLPDVSVSFSGSTYFFSAFIVAEPLEQNDVVLKMCYVEPERAVDMLLAHQLDFAISGVDISHPKLTTEEVISDPIGFSVLRSHRLSDREAISVQELTQETIYGLSPNSSFRRVCDSAFAALGVDLSYATEERHHVYTQRILSQDPQGGFLVARTTYEKSFKPAGDYVFLPFSDADIRQKITISYLTEGDRHQIYAPFLKRLKEYIVRVNAIHNQVGNALAGVDQQQ